VKYDDCREIIKLEDNSSEKNIFDFTCDYIRSNSGKILGGPCVHTETNEEDVCTEAYIYYANAELQCSEGTYPTIYDTCEGAE